MYINNWNQLIGKTISNVENLGFEGYYGGDGDSKTGQILKITFTDDSKCLLVGDETPGAGFENYLIEPSSITSKIIE